MTLDQLEKGRYRARFTKTDDEIVRAQAFRSRCFGLTQPYDVEALDDRCTHVLIETQKDGDLVCCFRLLELTGSALDHSYAAQYYDLTALQNYNGKLLELGRFCIDPARSDPDILRLAWSILTGYVDARGVRLLLGCTSFPGVDPTLYKDAFEFLRTRHLAPEFWAPRHKARETHRFGTTARGHTHSLLARKQLPPLLRSYLTMGAWVSDHAVIDRALNRLHVFTGLEIDAIPAQRKRLLRAL